MATQKRPVFLHWKKDCSDLTKTASKEGPRLEVKRQNASEKGKKRVKMSAISNPISAKSATEQERPKHKRNASLRDLCTPDKQRVRQLVEQLALVGGEKEQLEEHMLADRKQFSELLVKLKEEHQKVLKEKERVLDELQSSQLQLQELHTYPTLPSEVPHSDQSHGLTPTCHVTPVNSHMMTVDSHMRSLPLSHACHMTPVSSHMTSIDSSSLLQGPPYVCHMTPVNSHMTSEVNHVTPPLSSTTNSLIQGKPNNDRGNRHFIPPDEHWQTLPSTTPVKQNDAVSISHPNDKLTFEPSPVSKVDHNRDDLQSHPADTAHLPMTQSTHTISTNKLATTATSCLRSDHLTSLGNSGNVHSGTSVTGWGRLTDQGPNESHEVSTQTLNLESTSTQTDHHHDDHDSHLTVSDLTSSVPIDTTKPHPPQSHAMIHSLKVKGQKSVLLPTKLHVDSSTCTPEPHNGTDLSESNQRPTIHTIRPPIDAQDHSKPVKLDSSSTDTDLDSLLATALLNAQHTLYAIQTLNSTVSQEKSVLNGGSEINNGRNTTHGGIDLNGVSSNAAPGVDAGRRDTSAFVAPSTVKPNGLRLNGIGSSRVNNYSLSSFDSEIATSLNQTNSVRYPTHGSSYFGKSKMPRNSRVMSSLRANSKEVESLWLKPDQTIPDDEDTNYASLLKNRTEGIATTSTPYVVREYRGQRSQSSESRFGSTIDEDLACVSDIFEHARLTEESGHRSGHAQSLSKRLQESSDRSGHAQSFSQMLQRADNLESSSEHFSDSDPSTSSCYDDKHEDSDLIEDLFFI